jgi:hypothetical protein
MEWNKQWVMGNKSEADSFSARASMQKVSRYIQPYAFYFQLPTLLLTSAPSKLDLFYAIQKIRKDELEGK